MLIKGALTTAAIGAGVTIVNEAFGDSMNSPMSSASVQEKIKRGKQILRYAGY